jgi:hypothetical protein
LIYRLLTRDRVVECLGHTLETKWLPRVAQREPLAVDGANGDAPTGRILASQLRNVIGNFALADWHTLIIDILQNELNSINSLYCIVFIN